MTKEHIFCQISGRTLQIGMIEGKETKYYPKCDFVDYRNPLPVALAIAVKDEDFLSIKRGLPPKKRIWASPSGLIEIGETAEEACLRGLKEETGTSGEIVKLVGVVRREDKEVQGDMLVVEYLAKVGNEELTPRNEVEDVKLFGMADLPDYYVELYGNIIKEMQGQS